MPPPTDGTRKTLTGEKKWLSGDASGILKTWSFS